MIPYASARVTTRGLFTSSRVCFNRVVGEQVERVLRHAGVAQAGREADARAQRLEAGDEGLGVGRAVPGKAHGASAA